MTYDLDLQFHASQGQGRPSRQRFKQESVHSQTDTCTHTDATKRYYLPCYVVDNYFKDKKHLKNVGPIRHCEPPHALILHCHSPGVATVARRLRIDVHDNNDNA